LGYYGGINGSEQGSFSFLLEEVNIDYSIGVGIFFFYLFILFAGAPDCRYRSSIVQVLPGMGHIGIVGGKDILIYTGDYAVGLLYPF